MFSISVEPVLLQHPCMCQKQKSSPSVKSGTCELFFFLGGHLRIQKQSCACTSTRSAASDGFLVFACVRKCRAHAMLNKVSFE